MKNSKCKKLFICFIMLICFLYLGCKVTYTSYESKVGTDVSSQVANFGLLINGYDATKLNDILIDVIQWNDIHTREGKLAPGTCGYFELELDPSSSDVALLYKIKYVDRSVDASKLVNFDNITSPNSEIVRTGEAEYSGIITLDSIKKLEKPMVRVDFCFPNEGEQKPITEDSLNLDDFFSIDFDTYQYLGEKLVLYN